MIPLSREDRIDLLLLAIAIGSIVVVVKVTLDYLRPPLPWHRRILERIWQ